MICRAQNPYKYNTGFGGHYRIIDIVGIFQ